MFVNGQQVVVHMTKERHLSINVVPGKSKWKFAGRVWINNKGLNIVSITSIPSSYEHGPIYPPPGWKVQGLEEPKEEPKEEQ